MQAMLLHCISWVWNKTNCLYATVKICDLWELSSQKYTQLVNEVVREVTGTAIF